MKAIVTGIVFVLLTSSWVAAQSGGGNLKDGQAIYQQHCLRCHGEKLDGNGPDSKDLIVHPANFLSPAFRSKTDWELLVTISNGVLFTPMHSFRGKLNDQQMLDVLSYIRSVSPSGSVS
ncbi:MAG TPA: cytochrome c [Nitrospira sp.]|nr:cytochrome c [Nitrospira sp.]